MKNQNRKRQGGFTLVEIAIVLVIIGLLLGGVLKGQEMIENSKIKSITQDLNGVMAAANSYLDRYRGLPGDETPDTAATRGWAANVGGGDGNGRIGAPGANPFTTAAGENINFWRALRFSQFLSGDPATVGVAALPLHSGGGVIGVANGVFGITGNVVCVSGLSGKFAGAIDRTLDDGVNSTGMIRAAAVAAPAPAAPGAAAFNEVNGATWSLCKQL